MKSTDQIQAFIFDMDGVLFSTQEANDEAYAQALAALNIKVSSIFYKNLYGNKFEKVILTEHPTLNQKTIKQVKDLKHKYYREQLPQIKINKPLIDFINFSRSFVPIGLATSAARNNAMLIINHFNIAPLFSAFVFFEDVHEPKPNPECFQLCAKKLNVPIDSCIIWEDSKEGLEAARLSGAKFVKVFF